MCFTFAFEAPDKFITGACLWSWTSEQKQGKKVCKPTAFYQCFSLCLSPFIASKVKWLPEKKNRRKELHWSFVNCFSLRKLVKSRRLSHYGQVYKKKEIALRPTEKETSNFNKVNNARLLTVFTSFVKTHGQKKTRDETKGNFRPKTQQTFSYFRTRSFKLQIFPENTHKCLKLRKKGARKSSFLPILLVISMSKKVNIRTDPLLSWPFLFGSIIFIWWSTFFISAWRNLEWREWKGQSGMFRVY